MRKYDLTLVLSASLDKENQDKAIDKIKKLIADAGGKVNKIDEWGKRQLVFRIKKQNEGIYFNLDLEIEADKVKTINDKLKVEEIILRHLLVRKE